MKSEGRVRFEVPEDVFYNPEMEMNRDITVAMLNSIESSSYSDAFSASGVRGLRANIEAGYSVSLNDRSSACIDAARDNLDINDIDAIVSQKDANIFIRKDSSGILDIDPFGTPIPFIDSGFSNHYRYIFITATDTAPLCGAHESGERRYSCTPRNTEYHPEMGLRVLLGALVRTAARYDKEAKPVLSHVSDHYVRTYLKMDSGAKKADSSLEEIGYVSHCFECMYRDLERGMIYMGSHECPRCGTTTKIAGPLWLGKIHDGSMTCRVRENIEGYMGTSKRAKKLLEAIESEVDIPMHYDQHRLAQRWGESPGPIDELIESLRNSGFRASRTHYSGISFKTDAELDEIKNRMKSS